MADLPRIPTPLDLIPLPAIPDHLFERLAHPVYNALGRNIGYFIDDAQLARGQLQLYPGETAGAASEWTVKSPLGRVVSAAEYLVNKGLQPGWITPAAAQTLLQSTTGAMALKLPSLDLPALGLPQLGNAWPTYAGIGLGSLGLLLILKRRRR